MHGRVVAQRCRRYFEMVRSDFSSTWVTGTSLRTCMSSGDNQIAKFWLDPVTLERSGGMRRSDIRRVERIIGENRASFLRGWDVRFND